MQAAHMSGLYGDSPYQGSSRSPSIECARPFETSLFQMDVFFNSLKMTIGIFFSYEDLEEAKEHFLTSTKIEHKPNTHKRNLF